MSRNATASAPQIVMTVPLLVGTDGARKMSQSFDNYISVSDSADEMFGKTMSLPDEAMEEWFVLAAGRTDADAAADPATRSRQGQRHPGETKRQLAREVAALYWGEEAAVAAEAAFDRLFKDKAIPDDMPAFRVGASGSARSSCLRSSPTWRVSTKSRSEARRLIDQGAVKIDGERWPTSTVAACRRLCGASPPGRQSADSCRTEEACVTSRDPFASRRRDRRGRRLRRRDLAAAAGHRHDPVARIAAGARDCGRWRSLPCPWRRWVPEGLTRRLTAELDLL